LLFLLSYLLLLISKEQNIVLSDHVRFEIILLLSKILMYEHFFVKTDLVIQLFYDKCR